MVVVAYKLFPSTIGSLLLSDYAGPISVCCVLFVWSVLGGLLVPAEFVI